jgi:hypothetical protein
MLNVTIRIGATEDSITVDGKTFDRSTLSRPEKSKLRRLVVAAWG